MPNGESQVGQQLMALPLWMFILVALAGLSGEMYRAEAAVLTVGQLIKRIALRSGASVVFGIATIMLASELFGAGQLTSLALGLIVSLLGADMAGALYSRWIERRLGNGGE